MTNHRLWSTNQHSSLQHFSTRFYSQRIPTNLLETWILQSESLTNSLSSVQTQYRLVLSDWDCLLVRSPLAGLSDSQEWKLHYQYWDHTWGQLPSLYVLLTLWAEGGETGADLWLCGFGRGGIWSVCIVGTLERHKALCADLSKLYQTYQASSD